MKLTDQSLNCRNYDIWPFAGNVMTAPFSPTSDRFGAYDFTEPRYGTEPRAVATGACHSTGKIIRKAVCQTRVSHPVATAPGSATGRVLVEAHPDHTSRTLSRRSIASQSKDISCCRGKPKACVHSANILPLSLSAWR